MTAFHLLSDERIDAIANQMPNGLDGFLNCWGWRQFAEAIESESRAPLLAEIESLSAEVERLTADAERYRWLRERLLAADFDYQGEGLSVLVFEFPSNCSASADCDYTVDAARAQGGE